MQVYHHFYGLKTTSLRNFNVYGPRQKESTYSGAIAIRLGNIIRNEDLIIFGDGKFQEISIILKILFRLIY